MPNYSTIGKEETFKAAVFRDFFPSSKYAYEPNIGNIDFIVTEAKTIKGNLLKRHFLWAESKKGTAEIYDMLTQLVLTIKKTYDKGEHLPPPYLACFDMSKIAFVPFHDILPIFTDNDINWNVTPSNHTTDDFIKTKNKVEKLSKENIVVFDFDKDKEELKTFISNNLVSGNITARFQINKNNFIIIYTKWLEKVKKTIAIDWNMVKKSGIIDGDFFLADILAKENYTLKDKLFVILMNNQYKFDKKFDDAGFSLYKKVGFNDNQKAHKEFWDKYDRPPIEEYWDYIINRRDLLVPQDIREYKGSFFTPQIWVQKSQEYLSDVFGENWQDEYVIWDCAAGTGNLLAGLTNKYNIWASTLDKADVDVTLDRINNGANLLADHVFQFDFLNDDFDKLPKPLKNIIDDPKKREKLIIYINPPYAEATNKKAKGADRKNNVAKNMSNEIIKESLGAASNELFAHFMARIYLELKGCYLAQFSKLKFLNSNNFKLFRTWFFAEFKNGFVVQANTFDNVTGKFPIGFTIWDLGAGFSFPSNIELSVIEEGGWKKRFWSSSGVLINNWIKTFSEQTTNDICIGKLNYVGNDFQQNERVWLSINPSTSHIMSLSLNKYTIIPASVYFAARLCIEPSWLNDRDQFSFPNDNWQTDNEFQSDCLILTIFHGQNRVTAKDGTNHWIPYSEIEVNARTNFDSHFMYDFINGNIENTFEIDILTKKQKEKNKTLMFSDEAKAVFKAGKKLWQYYHAQPTANVNASLYDIREFFQGRDDSGKMNNKSGDDTYTALIVDLRSALKELAMKIQPKVYEYGFLLE